MTAGDLQEHLAEFSFEKFENGPEAVRKTSPVEPPGSHRTAGRKGGFGGRTKTEEAGTSVQLWGSRVDPSGVGVEPVGGKDSPKFKQRRGQWLQQRDDDPSHTSMCLFLNYLLLFPQLRKKYGNVYSLFLGTRPAVVISGVKTIKEVLIAKGSDFAGRPQDMFVNDAIKKNGKAHWRAENIPPHPITLVF